MKAHAAGGRSGGLALLVEDDERVGHVTVRLLERCGWRTVHVTRGDEALARLEDAELQIDLALVDFSLPDLNGDQLATSIRARRPGVPIVLTSGHALEPRDGIDSILRKPYGLQELRDLVEALDHSE